MYPDLKATIQRIQSIEVPKKRKNILQSLITYIKAKQEMGSPLNLNFICTHNSRRSQFSQAWAYTAAFHFGVSGNFFSGGVEVTSFNSRAVVALTRSGFKITSHGTENPEYTIAIDDNLKPLTMFSKLFDDPINKAEHFAAIMTCSHADENCPFIPGTEKRIAVNYDDPKEFDDTPLEAEKYDERSLQIASEMFYVFSKI